MKLGSFVVLVWSSLVCCTFAGVQVKEALTEADLAGLKSVFTAALAKQSDVQSVFYAVNGLTLLKEKIPNSAAVCTFLSSKVDVGKTESLYFGSRAASGLENCKLKTEKARETLTAAIKDGATSQELYFAAAATSALGFPLDSEKLKIALLAATKKENDAESLGYAFSAASYLNLETFPLLDRIEDALAQADEVDGQFAQYEGGVVPTAIVVAGIFRLSAAAKKAPPAKEDVTAQLANYLLSRKGVQQVRLAYHALNGISFLADNQFFVPVVITVSSDKSVSPVKPVVQIRVSNIRGGPLSEVTAVVDTATHVATSGVVLNKKSLTAVAGGKFEFNFLEQKREKGFYKLSVQVQSKDKRLIATKAELLVKVLTEIVVDGVELSIVDREQTSTSNVAKLQHPSKFATLLEADFHQKIIMKFSLKEKGSSANLRVHQAFVSFNKLDTKQEIVFVAEPDSTKTYKFDVDLQKSAKDFDFLSGKYSMKLIIGDSVILNPFVWHMADINLKFPEKEKTPKQSQDITYDKLPEIKHMFREPEVRPPGVVSDAFTVLVLVPLVILLILWLRIGINFSNFSFSMSALGYHIGLAGIFGLYYMFWLKLNMFVTLKYLAGIGGFTFITGNAMLRAMAERRKAKSD